MESCTILYNPIKSYTILYNPMHFYAILYSRLCYRNSCDPYTMPDRIL